MYECTPGPIPVYHTNNDTAHYSLVPVLYQLSIISMSWRLAGKHLIPRVCRVCPRDNKQINGKVIYEPMTSQIGVL